MILFLTLVLLFLMITIGGERGAVSIMALAGNIIILFFSVILMSAGFPALLLILAASSFYVLLSEFSVLSEWK